MILTTDSLITPVKKLPKTLILVPDLNMHGGVSNYYNTLKLETNGNISYFFVNHKPQPFIAKAIRLIVNYFIFFYKVIKYRYELIIVNPSLDRNSFYRDSVFLIISWVLNRRTFVFFRGWLDLYEQKIKKSRFKSFLFRISYAKADKFLVLSRLFQKRLLEMGVSPRTEFFIETTVADSSYVNELDLRRKYVTYNEKIIFLFLSRVEKTKGIYIAINAYNKFLSRFPERKSCFYIAGDGSELSAVKRYVELNNISHIHFLGHVSADEKKKALLESHVMIFPSYTEGLPNCILEGMLYGMPIISRMTGGIPDIIHQEINGYLSESFEPSVFADFISLLALNAELYKQISKKNHIIALENYTSEKVRERILKIYGDS